MTFLLEMTLLKGQLWEFSLDSVVVWTNLLNTYSNQSEQLSLFLCFIFPNEISKLSILDRFKCRFPQLLIICTAY